MTGKNPKDYPVQMISVNSDFTRCQNYKCSRKEQCKRFLTEEEKGLFYMFNHRGKCEKCKNFILKESERRKL